MQSLEKILIPSSNLRLKPEMEEDFNEGIVFDILTPGHVTSLRGQEPMVLLARKEKVLERAQFSNYPLLPTKFDFVKVVRIYGYIFKFIKNHKCMEKRMELRKKTEQKFRMFVAQELAPLGYLSVPLTLHFLKGQNDLTLKGNVMTAMPTDRSGIVVQMTDDMLNQSLNFLFKKASDEVRQFYPKERLKKISIEKEGILYSKSRILDGQRFILAGDLKDSNILIEKNLNLFTPVLDRFSPLSYSLANYIHVKMMKHAGEESSYRCSLGHCFIIQGLGLFREIIEDCVQCKKLRKKFIEVSMGGISDHQLTIAPPFWVCMGDLFGPVDVYVPGFERNTRNRKVLEAKVYIATFVCPTTKVVNAQVIETKSVEGIFS